MKYNPNLDESQEDIIPELTDFELEQVSGGIDIPNIDYGFFLQIDTSWGLSFDSDNDRKSTAFFAKKMILGISDNPYKIGSARD
jgi:hypothetical protein